MGRARQIWHEAGMFEQARKVSWLVFLGCAGATAAGAPPPKPPAAPRLESSLPTTAEGPAVSLPELRVGTSGDYAPFSTRSAEGASQGFDPELAEQLASDLGLSLRWVPFRWPELAAHLSAGEFDVAMGGVTWQPARAVSGYMTRAVARGGPCVLGDVAAPRVAVNRGGILEAWARGRFSDRELVTVDDRQHEPAAPALPAPRRRHRDRQLRAPLVRATRLGQPL